MSSTLSYTHAKVLLTEVEKDRIVCTYLNSTEPNAVSTSVHLPRSLVPSANKSLFDKVDWDKAASEYGAASVESYKKGMQNTTKKIKKSMDSGVEPEAVEGSTVKKSGGKKRKEKSVVAEGEAGAETEETPTKKKKGGKKTKAQKAAEAAAAAENDEDGDVKAEVDEE
jgi:glutamyl/glutaminyl-tRNA synthetase